MLLDFDLAEHNGLFKDLANVFGDTPLSYHGRVVCCRVHLPPSRESRTEVARSVGGSTSRIILPQKRRATESSAGDTPETIVLSTKSDRSLTRPDHIDRDGVTFSLIALEDLGLKLRSVAWSFFELYLQEDSSSKDLLSWCRLCGGLGSTTVLSIPAAVIGNSVKHFENVSNGRGAVEKKLAHSRAALFICRNLSGGNPTKRGGDANVARHFTTDVRPHHLRFVLMQVMSHSPRILTTSPYLESFVSNLNASYSTPAVKTMTHILVELYSFTLDAVRDLLRTVKVAYGGLPFAHAAMDVWTERHSRLAFGSVVIRFVEPATTSMRVLHLGVSLFVGNHTHDVIWRWFHDRLRYFGLDAQDLGSTRTDSGANVRKAMRLLPVAWIPCMAHAIHNSVVVALGSWGKATEVPEQSLDGRSCDASSQDAGEPDDCSAYPTAKTLPGQVRKTAGHFNHSDKSVATYRGLSIPGESEARNIITEVPTRWNSTYNACARLLTSHQRFSAFFNPSGLPVRVQRRRLSSSDWDRLRQLLGVLKGAMEVSRRSQSATDSVSAAFFDVCSLRRMIASKSFVVPCLPGSCPLAAGKKAIDAYCEANPDAHVIKIDARLYPAEKLYYNEGDGQEVLCDAARATVRLLRKQLDARFFNLEDETRDLLQSGPVLRSAVSSPGGAKLLKAASKMLGRPSVHNRVVTALREVCDRLEDPVAAAVVPTPSPSRSRPSRAAWSCLADFTDEEDSMGGMVPEQTQASLAKARLDSCLKVVATSRSKDPLEFWKENKERYPTLYLVACAFLGAVGTSAASERDFSVAASIMRKELSSMLARHLKMHCIIQDNVNLFPANLQTVPKLSHEAADKVRSAMPTGRSRRASDADSNSSSDEDEGAGQ